MVTPASNSLPQSLLMAAAAQERASTNEVQNLTMEASVAMEAQDTVRFQRCMTRLNQLASESFTNVKNLTISDAAARQQNERLQREFQRVQGENESMRNHYTNAAFNTEQAGADLDSRAVRARRARGGILSATFDARDARAAEVPAVSFRERISHYSNVAWRALENAWPYIRTGLRVGLALAGFAISIASLVSGGGGGAAAAGSEL